MLALHSTDAIYAYIMRVCATDLKRVRCWTNNIWLHYDTHTVLYHLSSSFLVRASCLLLSESAVWIFTRLSHTYKRKKTILGEFPAMMWHFKDTLGCTGSMQCLTAAVADRNWEERLKSKKRGEDLCQKGKEINLKRERVDQKKDRERKKVSLKK